jgi:hypothetical protein
MATENNKKDDVLNVQELQIALFEMRDSLMQLSLQLKDYLFEAQLANQALESGVQEHSANENAKKGLEKR